MGVVLNFVHSPGVRCVPHFYRNNLEISIFSQSPCLLFAFCFPGFLFYLFICLLTFFVAKSSGISG